MGEPGSQVQKVIKTRYSPSSGIDVQRPRELNAGVNNLGVGHRFDICQPVGSLIKKRLGPCVQKVFSVFKILCAMESSEG